MIILISASQVVRMSCLCLDVLFLCKKHIEFQKAHGVLQSIKVRKYFNERSGLQKRPSMKTFYFRHWKYKDPNN
jgi:hypothetical protein